MHQAQTQILVIEDEPVSRSALVIYLESQGFAVSEAASAEEAETILSQGAIDLMLVDVNLPGKDGLRLAREQRAISDIGIILVSGRDDDVDRIVGLEIGADDYVCKPFNRRELLARIKNLLYRTGQANHAQRQLYRFERFTFDSRARRLEDPEGNTVPLTRAEFEVLFCLVTHAGQVVTRDALMGRVTHRQYGTNPRTVDVLVRRLRAKLEPDPAQPMLICTVHGEGYSFTPRVT